VIGNDLGGDLTRFIGPEILDFSCRGKVKNVKPASIFLREFDGPTGGDQRSFRITDLGVKAVGRRIAR